jgi:hypothetical protein
MQAGFAQYSRATIQSTHIQETDLLLLYLLLLGSPL